ncbi:MAG: recombinase family protein [Planctomycetota bacterium]|nr:recombinase family protein [Planctomycetota bacterium]
MGSTAFAVAQKRGVKLGRLRLGRWKRKKIRRRASLQKACTAAPEAHSETFDDEYADLFPIVKELNEAGSSLQAIADELNAMGHTTRRNKPWNRMQVSRVLNRAA